MERKRSLIGAFVPIVAAVIIICAFAVGGHMTKNTDAEAPTAETSTTEETTTEALSTVTNTVDIVAVGDNLIHNTLIWAGEQEDGTLDYTSFYTQIKKDISEADIAIINQETILGGDAFDYSGYPCFNTPWEVGTAAIDAGFDIFTCATNHSLDMGYTGIEQECKFFDEHSEVVHVGTNDTEEEYNTIVYYTKNDISFALLNYTYSTNGISLPSGKEWCVNMMDEDKVTADIKTARENADVVIVFPHWGTENSTEISSFQEYYTELFSDLGVDIVIGCHPHVLQSVQWVENEDTGKKMIVYYSLGNFISHQLNLEQLCGGMAKITVTKTDGEISIDAASLVPVVCWYSAQSGSYEFSVYKLGDYTNDLAASHTQSGATVEYFTSLCESVVPAEFLEMS